MRSRPIVSWAGCVMMAVLTGCVSKAQLETVSNDYHDAQLALEQSQAAADQCRKDKTELLDQIEYNKSEIGRLSQRVETSDQIIKENEFVISLQSTFIRLFDDSKQTLQTSINEQIAAHQIETTATAPPVRVVLVNKLLFDPGSARLSAEGQTLLSNLTGLIKDQRYPHIRVQGHTDNRPLKSTSWYASNWELSVARATAVVRFLQETVGVKPERISATGFGQYRPIARSAGNCRDPDLHCPANGCILYRIQSIRCAGQLSCQYYRRPLQ